MRLSVDGRSVAYFFYFLFSRVDKGVSDDFVLRLKMRLKIVFQSQNRILPLHRQSAETRLASDLKLIDTKDTAGRPADKGKKVKR